MYTNNLIRLIVQAYVLMYLLTSNIIFDEFSKEVHLFHTFYLQTKVSVLCSNLKIHVSVFLLFKPAHCPFMNHQDVQTTKTLMVQLQNNFLRNHLERKHARNKFGLGVVPLKRSYMYNNLIVRNIGASEQNC